MSYNDFDLYSCAGVEESERNQKVYGYPEKFSSRVSKVLT